MSSTCPYILAKTLQLCTAARISTQNESFKEGLTSNKIFQKLSKLSTNIKTLKVETSGYFKPPRLNLQELSRVASSICVQIRDQKLLNLDTVPLSLGSEHETSYIADIDENVDFGDSNMRDVCTEHLSVQNKCVLFEKTEKYFVQYGISEDELHR
jgi:hypothetical protein